MHTTSTTNTASARPALLTVQAQPRLEAQGVAGAQPAQTHALVRVQRVAHLNRLLIGDGQLKAVLAGVPAGRRYRRAVQAWAVQAGIGGGDLKLAAGSWLAGWLSPPRPPPAAHTPGSTDLRPKRTAVPKPSAHPVRVRKQGTPLMSSLRKFEK